MIDGQKINLWVLHVLCSPTNYARGQGGLLNKVLFGKAPLQGPVRGEV